MENPEEVLQWLEEVSRRRPAVIPRALDDYLAWVARTGEPVYRWPLVRALLKEKLAAVVAEYRAQPPGLELPPCPNVPPFDCDAMRTCFLAKLDAFRAPPFTVQRICELLAHPRKHYNRIDKFMRAFEKNILVVSTKRSEPFRHSSDGDSQLDGSDVNDVNSDANDIEDGDWKDRPRTHRQSAVNGPLEPPASSSDDDRDRRSTDSEEEPETPPIEETELEETTPHETERPSDLEPEPEPELEPEAEEEQPQINVHENLSPPEIEVPIVEHPIEADKPAVETIETNIDVEELKPQETVLDVVEPIIEEKPFELVEETKEEPHEPAPIIEPQEPPPTVEEIEPPPPAIEEIEPVKADVVETEPISIIPVEPVIAEIPVEPEPTPMDCGTEIEDIKESIEPKEPDPVEPEAMDCSEDIAITETKPPEDISDVIEEIKVPTTTAAIVQSGSP